MNAFGATTWVIAAGRIPVRRHQEPGRLPRQLEHHPSERACALNTGAVDAEVTITVFFDGRAPLEPSRVTVPARSLRYIDLAELRHPVPAGVDFSAVLTSTQPIVVDHVQRLVHGDTVTTVSGPAHPIDRR